MKILEVNIDRFGQFHHWSCAFEDTNFLTIFGPNEAGKSTLVAFIKCIFFGFPRKNELEPYIGGIDRKNDLGGSVTLEVADLGKIRIVRHYQQKGGSATVLLENGEMASSEILSDWFQGIDREIYDAIFCFNLDGLNGIEHLKPNELNRYLFSTGMMGNAELYDLEKRLEKESSDLFKTGGQKPLINQTISELNTLQDKMTAWEKQMQEYMTLKENAINLSEELEKASVDRQQLEQEKREYQRYKACESLLIDYKRMEEEIAYLPDTSHFPEDGKARFDKWKTHIVPLQAEQTDLEKKIIKMKDSLGEFGENDPILQYEKNIKVLQHESAERGTWEKVITKLREQIRVERTNISSGLEQLNMADTHFEAIKAIPVTLVTKQTLKNFMQKWQELMRERSAFDITLKEEKGKLQTIKEKEQDLKRALMPEKQFIELEREMKDYHPDNLEKEKERLDQEWSAMKHGHEMAGLLGRLKIGVTVGVLALFIVLTGILSQTLNLVVGFIMAGLGVIISTSSWLIFNGIQNRFKPAINEKGLLKRKKEIDDLSAVDISQNLYLYEQEKAKREQLTIITAQLDESEKTYGTYLQKLEEINLKLIDLEAEIGEWQKSLGLATCEISILPDVYQLTEKVREEILHLEGLEKEAKDYQNHMDQFDNRVKLIASHLGDSDMNLHECGARLEQAIRNKEKKTKLSEALSLLQEGYESLNEKITRYEQECQSLMNQAGVDLEDEFYRLAYIHDQRSTKNRQRESLNRQLCHLVPQEDDRKIYFNWLINDKWAGQAEDEYARQIDENDQHIKQLQKQLSDINSHIDFMEKDETYAELLHGFEEKRYFLNEQAKKWSVINLALSLLKQAKENYRETRLPKVLANASDYFHQITNQKYKKIYYTESDGFTIEKTDGTLFETGELSRGTSEQLYLSLRFALVDIYKTSENLPIIIDDGFVNFDGERRPQVLDVLNKVATERQVLLFTCHRYKIKNIFELTNKDNGGGLNHVGLVISDSSR